MLSYESLARSLQGSKTVVVTLKAFYSIESDLEFWTSIFVKKICNDHSKDLLLLSYESLARSLQRSKTVVVTLKAFYSRE